MTENAGCLMLDMGKVLLDIDPRKFAHKMKLLTGLDEQRLARIFLHNGLVPKYETGRIDETTFYREVCSKCGVAIPRQDFEAAWNSIFNSRPILPERLLSTLSGKTRLWILSNTNKLHFDYISAHFSFLRYFEGYVLSHEVGALKPDPSIFASALKRAQALPPDVLFVDDQIANVEAARQMGMDAFQYRCLDTFQHELRLRGLL